MGMVYHKIRASTVHPLEGIFGGALATKREFGAGINQSNISLQKARALDW